MKDHVEKFVNKREKKVWLLLFIVAATVCVFFEMNVKSPPKDMQSDINIVKKRVDFEGRLIKRHYDFSQKLDKNEDVESLVGDKGNYQNRDVNWKLPQNNEPYIELLRNGYIAQQNALSDIDYYEMLCRTIQQTHNDEFVRLIDDNEQPAERSLDDIDKNLDCIYVGDTFKVIYYLGDVK